jgi:MscS family membrane protein
LSPVNHSLFRVAILTALTVALQASAVLARLPGVPTVTQPAPAAASDVLGRDTPLGTVTGLSAAVHRGDLEVAIRYLEGRGRSPADLEELATDLNDLLDRYFTSFVASLSNQPGGVADDGLAPNRERLYLAIGNQREEIYLVRVTESGGSPVWLFASDSLRRVSSLHDLAQATWVERIMPTSLVSRRAFGMSLAQWVLWAASIAIPWLVFWSLALLVGTVVPRRIEDLTRRALFISWWKGLRWLLVLALTLLTHMLVLPQFGFSLRFRYLYGRVALIAAVVILSLLGWRLVSITFRQARLLALRRGRTNTGSLIQLAERVVKVMVVLLAIAVLLTIGGVDLTTALAGVGIAGVAVALGAQKSVENLLGGIFLLVDKALAIGDYCKVLDREGVVEDITLRSVRLRTPERTLLSVPAGMLSQGSIENFATRDKILMKNLLRLRYGTTLEQLHLVLARTHQLLAAEPYVDQSTARVRLVAYGAQAIEIELFAYLVTSDYLKFLEVRENLLLQVGRIVEASGSGFAAPTEFIQMGAEPLTGSSRTRPVPAVEEARR